MSTIANRYATQTFTYWDVTSSKHETVHMGSLRDSTSHACVQYPGLFGTTPLTTQQITGVLQQYLLANPGGP